MGSKDVATGDIDDLLRWRRFKVNMSEDALKGNFSDWFFFGAARGRSG